MQRVRHLPWPCRNIYEVHSSRAIMYSHPAFWIIGRYRGWQCSPIRNHYRFDADPKKLVAADRHLSLSVAREEPLVSRSGPGKVASHALFPQTIQPHPQPPHFSVRDRTGLRAEVKYQYKPMDNNFRINIVMNIVMFLNYLIIIVSNVVLKWPIGKRMNFRREIVLGRGFQFADLVNVYSIQSTRLEVFAFHFANFFLEFALT